jgi:hypothetical protein
MSDSGYIQQDVVCAIGLVVMKSECCWMGERSGAAESGGSRFK